MIINKKKIFFFYLLLYLTLLVSLFFQENTTGGAEYDFGIISKEIIIFSTDLKYALNNFHLLTTSHFPFYYIFLSFFYNDYFNFFVIKIIVLHLSLFLPLVFYKLLNLKFNYQSEYLLYIPGILFLSPSYRTAAVWAFNDNIALIFFSLSILFFLKFSEEKKNKKKIIFIFLNILFLALASYIRQYYAIFTIFFLYKFIKQKNLNLFLIYILINAILSLPAIIFVYGSNYGSDNMTYAYKFLSTNLITNSFLILNIFFIYLIPIYLEKKNIKNLFDFYSEKKITAFLILLVTITFLFFLDYSMDYGGGIIYQLFFKSETIYLFYFISYLSLLFIFHFTYLNYRNNLIIIVALILMFPLYAIFQKYLDPLSIILIFCLFENKLIKNYINNLKVNIKLLYLYFLLIYVGSLVYRTII